MRDLSRFMPGRLAPLLTAYLLAAPVAGHATIWTVTGTGEPASIGSISGCVGATGQCSTLRDAINSAASGDTIRFSSSIDGGTIELSLYSNAATGTEFGPSAFFLTGAKTLTLDGITGLTRGITIARASAQSPFRLLDIDSGSTLTLLGLTLQNGLAQGFDADYGGGALGAGGAIFTQGSLTVDKCTFAENVAQGGASGDGSGAYSGAGVGSVPSSNGGGPNGATSNGGNGGFGGGGSAYDQGGKGGFGGGGGSGGNGGAGGFGGGAGGASGGLSGGAGGFGGGGNNKSVFGGAGAGMGGAIFNDAGFLQITNSTLVDNSAVGGSAMAPSDSAANGSGFGGAIFNYNGGASITYVTLADNFVSAGIDGGSGGSADGGAIYSLGDAECATGGNSCGETQVTLLMQSSILAESFGNSAGINDLVVTAINGGVSSTAADSLDVTNYDPNQIAISNLKTADPQLGPLGYHGGWSATMLPAFGSAVIDATDCFSAPPILKVDQRGIARPQGNGCDLGSVEMDYIFANGFE